MPLVTYVLPRTNITVSNAFIIGEQVKFLRDLHTYLGSHISVGWIRTWTYWFSQFVEQKSVKRQGLLKGKFALFQGPATRQRVGGGVGGGGGETRVQRLTPCCWRSLDKGFYRWREGTTCRNSAVSSDGHHEIHHCSLTSVTLIVSKTIHLQFQGWIVSNSLRPFFRTVPAYVVTSVCSSCSSLLHLGFQGM